MSRLTSRSVAGYRCVWMILIGVALASAVVDAETPDAVSPAEFKQYEGGRFDPILRGQGGRILDRYVNDIFHPDDDIADLPDARNPWKINLGGWIDAAVSYNPDTPQNQSNLPAGTNDRIFTQQIGLFIDKRANITGDSVDIGGRASLMWGRDARYAVADGFDDDIVDDRFAEFDKLAFPETFFEIYVPVGNGVNISLGHFASPMGLESPFAQSRFFHSSTHDWTWGLPHTMTGFIAETPITDNFIVYGGWTLPDQWDNSDGGNGITAGAAFILDPDGEPMYVGPRRHVYTDRFAVGPNTTPTPRSRLFLDYSYFSDAPAGGRNPSFGDFAPETGNRHHVAISAEHAFTPTFTPGPLITQFQATYGRQQDAAAKDVSSVIEGDFDAAQWYGLSASITTPLCGNRVWGGLRFAWFKDEDGFAVPGPFDRVDDNLFPSPVPDLFRSSGGGNYYSLSAAVNYFAYDNVRLGAEVRYDYSDVSYSDFDREGNFDDGSDNDQVLLKFYITTWY